MTDNQQHPEFGQPPAAPNYYGDPRPGENSYGTHQPPAAYGNAGAVNLYGAPQPPNPSGAAQPMLPNQYGAQPQPGGFQQPFVAAQSVYFVAPPRPKGLSTTSMILALVSVFFGFTFVLPVLALILGIAGLRKEPAGKGMALTGVIISGLILSVWVVIGLIVIIGAVAAAGAAASLS